MLKKKLKLVVSKRREIDQYGNSHSVTVNTFVPDPLSRIYIPKERGEELRPLGLGTIKDKLIQNDLNLYLILYYKVFQQFQNYFPYDFCKPAQKFF